LPNPASAPKTPLVWTCGPSTVFIRKKDGGVGRGAAAYIDPENVLLRHLRSGLSGIGDLCGKKICPPGWKHFAQINAGGLRAEVTIAPKPPAVRWLKKRVVVPFAEWPAGLHVRPLRSAGFPVIVTAL